MARFLTDEEVMEPMARQALPPSPSGLLTDEQVMGGAPIGPTEITPTLGGIVDDPARAAPAATIANASLFPNIKDRIPVYAKALGVPASEFAVMDDKIVYRDPKNPNQYVRVEPSVSGATGPVDALKRVGLYAAGSTGPAIPALASMAAGMATRGNLASIAAAGGAGGVADMGRQALGQAINGGNPTDIDFLNSAGQAAMGAAGQAVGVGLQSAFERVPPGLASADREWMRNPANVANARANAQLLSREGITGMNGAITDRGSLIAADRQMMRNAGTADPMRETVRRINTEEVPAALERAATRIAPNRGVDQSARVLQEAAEPVIEAPRDAGNLVARPFYRQAEQGAQTWTPELAQLADNYPAVQSALRRASVTYQNMTGRPPPDVPDFRLWDLAKKQLDADYNAANSAVLPAERASLTGIDTARRSLVSALDDLYPPYAQARAAAQPGMQASARLREGVLGGLERTGPDVPAPQVLGKMFDAARTSPAAIAESRQAFEAAGRGAQFEEAFSAYVRSVADKAQRTLASGETGNVAGKIHAELFSTDAKRRAAAAALGGENTPAYRQFAETMRAMDIASRVPAMGSQTATDLGQTGAVASPTARAVAAPFRMLSPGTWTNLGNRAADAIEGGSASRAAARTAAGYASGPSANGMLLEGVRIMNPAVAGLLSAGGRGGVGFLPGLLGIGVPPADWQPYQPPLPR